MSGSMIGTEAMGHTGKSSVHRAGNGTVSLARGPCASGTSDWLRELGQAGLSQEELGKMALVITWPFSQDRVRPGMVSDSRFCPSSGTVCARPVA